MSVRAKFVCTGFTASHTNTFPHRLAGGELDYNRPVPVEMRSVKLTPVYGNGDPTHENTSFWNATPAGSIELGTINPGAWQQFEIGKEYYVDFTPAAKTP
jgi:hypothetical protein